MLRERTQTANNRGTFKNQTRLVFVARYINKSIISHKQQNLFSENFTARRQMHLSNQVASFATASD